MVIDAVLIGLIIVRRGPHDPIHALRITPRWSHPRSRW
jgi:hypothetical protein